MAPNVLNLPKQLDLKLSLQTVLTALQALSEVSAPMKVTRPAAEEIERQLAAISKKQAEEKEGKKKDKPAEGGQK